MFPTQFKSKLPKSMSYPVGSADLFQVLGAMPQRESISIDFGFRSALVPGRRGRDTQYNVLVASCSHHQSTQFSPKKWRERGDYEPKWSIWVAAVPRMHRHVVREHLMTTGLITVREWFCTIGLAGANEGTCNVVLSFDETQQMFACERNDWRLPTRLEPK